MKRYKFLSAALLGALLTMGTVTSCSDSGYLDINYNPDYPTTATYKQLFPSAFTFAPGITKVKVG